MLVNIIKQSHTAIMYKHDDQIRCIQSYYLVAYQLGFTNFKVGNDQLDFRFLESSNLAT